MVGRKPTGKEIAEIEAHVRAFARLAGVPDPREVGGRDFRADLAALVTRYQAMIRP